MALATAPALPCPGVTMAPGWSCGGGSNSALERSCSRCRRICSSATSRRRDSTSSHNRAFSDFSTSTRAAWWSLLAVSDWGPSGNSSTSINHLKPEAVCSWRAAISPFRARRFTVSTDTPSTVAASDTSTHRAMALPCLHHCICCGLRRGDCRMCYGTAGEALRQLLAVST
jgi:hypothetical protein